MPRRIHLNAFAMNCAGHQSAGLWRHPDDRGHDYTDVHAWVRLARTLEDAGFDALFLADVLGVYDVYGGSRDAAVRAGAQGPSATRCCRCPRWRRRPRGWASE